MIIFDDMIHSIKNIFFIVVLFIIFQLNCCHRNIYSDPFWDINLSTDKTTILKKLNEQALKGNFKSCIFSFERKFYVQTQNFDARLTGNLSYPVFVNDELNKISYSFLVEFKNERTYTFNNDFYRYFVGELEKNYGKPREEKVEAETINIKWLVNNRWTVTAHVLKDMNTYQVTVSKT